MWSVTFGIIEVTEPNIRTSSKLNQVWRKLMSSVTFGNVEAICGLGLGLGL